MAKPTKRILNVTVKKMYDDSPDTSWLGEYSDRPKSEYAIDRANDEFTGDQETGRGDDYWDSRNYRYFNGPVENYKGETPENIRKYVRQDYERMEGLNSGDWCFLGVRAEAEIQLTATWENSVVSKASWHSPIAPYQTITSGGLWGNESDMPKDDWRKLCEEQLAELKDQLLALGFSRRAIATAFKSVEYKDGE